MPRQGSALVLTAAVAALIGCTGAAIEMPVANPGPVPIDTTALTITHTSPTAVFGTLRFNRISAGRNFTCAVSTATAAYCWGDNTLSQLGEGALATQYVAPVAVSGLFTFTEISAGLSHACAVSQAGVVRCWGENTTGQLGDATLLPRSTPVLVSGGRVFGEVDAGGRSCGFVAGGATFCWGARSVVDSGTPPVAGLDSVPVLLSTTLNFNQLSVGATFACGVSTGLRALCWGANESGQLGNGTTTFSVAPVQATTPFDVTAVSASLSLDKRSHSCALVPGGAAYCWGDNTFGQLGDSTTTNRTSPVAVAGGQVFSAISAGAQFTCGVTTFGVGFCWGRVLGNGTTNKSSVPVRVSGTQSWTLISAGATHACGITGTGVAYCWGSDSHGQIGDGP